MAQLVVMYFLFYYYFLFFYVANCSLIYTNVVLCQLLKEFLKWIVNTQSFGDEKTIAEI